MFVSSQRCGGSQAPVASPVIPGAEEHIGCSGEAVSLLQSGSGGEGTVIGGATLSSGRNSGKQGSRQSERSSGTATAQQKQLTLTDDVMLFD